MKMIKPNLIKIERKRRRTARKLFRDGRSKWATLEETIREYGRYGPHLVGCFNKGLNEIPQKEFEKNYP